MRRLGHPTLALLLTACGAAADRGSSRPPDAGIGPATRTTDAAVVACVEHPPRRASSTATTAMPIVVMTGGKLVNIGQPVAIAGGTLTLSNFRFYLSEVTLVRADGTETPADVMDLVSGAPAAFGVQLVNLDDDGSLILSLAAPPGTYTAMRFLFGLPDACNGFPTGSMPLSDASQMTWPHGFGHLFLRYDANVNGPTGADAPAPMIHMGGFPHVVFAPRVTAAGPITVGASGPGVQRLRVDLDQVLKAARLPAPAADYPVPPPPGSDVELGEHVRQNAAALPIFAVDVVR